MEQNPARKSPPASVSSEGPEVSVTAGKPVSVRPWNAPLLKGREVCKFWVRERWKKNVFVHLKVSLDVSFWGLVLVFFLFSFCLFSLRREGKFIFLLLNTAREVRRIARDVTKKKKSKLCWCILSQLARSLPAENPTMQLPSCTEIKTSAFFPSVHESWHTPSDRAFNTSKPFYTSLKKHALNVPYSPEGRLEFQREGTDKWAYDSETGYRARRARSLSAATWHSHSNKCTTRRSLHHSDSEILGMRTAEVPTTLYFGGRPGHKALPKSKLNREKTAFLYYCIENERERKQILKKRRIFVECEWRTVGVGEGKMNK